MDYMACGSEYYGRGGSEGQENIEKPQEQALPRQENEHTHIILTFIVRQNRRKVNEHI